MLVGVGEEEMPRALPLRGRTCSITSNLKDRSSGEMQHIFYDLPKKRRQRNLVGALFTIVEKRCFVKTAIRVVIIVGANHNLFSSPCLVFFTESKHKCFFLKGTPSLRTLGKKYVTVASSVTYNITL